MVITSPLTDIRLLLPLAAGQHVWLPAGQSELAAALTADGLKVATEGIAVNEPPAGAMMDHLILPARPAERFKSRLAAVAPILKPGGYILFALRPWQWGRLRSWLAEQGLGIVATYGVHPGLHQPSVLIPLADNKPALFYLRQRYVPYSLWSRVARPPALWLARWGLHRLLFQEWLVVGRRAPAGGVS